MQEVISVMSSVNPASLGPQPLNTASLPTPLLTPLGFSITTALAGQKAIHLGAWSRPQLVSEQKWTIYLGGTCFIL